MSDEEVNNIQSAIDSLVNQDAVGFAKHVNDELQARALQAVEIEKVNVGQRFFNDEPEQEEEEA